MPMLFCLAHASCAKGLSTEMPITSAPSDAYSPSPCDTLHISVVHTPVNARGKNRTTVFLLPKFVDNFTSASPSAFLDLSEKSGALEPTERGIENFGVWVFDFRF